MAHPFFDALTYPWARPEAIRFHKMLYTVYSVPVRIDQLYKACQPDLPPLALWSPPDVIWKEALETLASRGALRRLCELVQGDGSVKNTETVQSAIRHVLDAQTTGAGQPEAGEHLPSPNDPPPLPGPLPPGSQMRLGRNQIFTGRQRDLQTLAGLLLHGPGCAAVTGWGGVGKTQLAVEFCHRYGRFFRGGVFWLNAASPETLAADLAQCGLSMGLQPWPDKRPEQIAAVLRAWQSGELRLVVFDNLEDLDLARAWLPQLGGGVRVLITARRRQWPADLAIAEHPLDVLARAESLALLRHLAPRLVRQPDGEIDPVANALGDLPLAIDLAGRYLADRPGLSPAGYLEELARAGVLAHKAFDDWTEAGDSPTGHATSLAATFLVSWGRLKPDVAVDALAAKLFRAAAWCAANTAIPRAVFYRLEDGQEAAVDRALKRLAVLGLLGGDEEGPLIHPLLAEFGQRIETGAPSPLPALAEGLADLAQEANDEMDRTGSFAPHQALWPHVQAVAGRAETEAPEAAGSLWNSLGYHLSRMADYANSRAAHERALASAERAFGPDHPKVAIVVNNLGSVLQDLGDLPAARAAYERALAIDERTFGPDHPTVAIRVNNLGSVRRALGDLPAARAAYERALTIDERTFGPDHPTVAICVNNLGSVLQDLGDLPAARAAYERALAIDERTFGPDHPNVAIDVGNLGRVLRAQGDLAGARAAFERALAIFEQRLPPGHRYIEIARRDLESVQ